MTSRTIAYATLTQSRDSWRNTLPQKPRALSTTAIRTRSSATALISSSLGAWVDRRLDHIDQEVEEYEEQREHKDRALQQRQVALEDRRIEQEAGAGPREHGLDQDRT